MKKIILVCSMIGAFWAMESCSTQNQATTQTQTSNPTLNKMKGEWQIVSVDYNEKKFKIKPFDEGADAQCFVGSVWRFIPNNNTGSYTIQGGGSCPTVVQPIKFEATKDGDFRFKKLEQGVKAKNITAGYILQLSNYETNSFTLVQDVPFEGEIIKVYYNFQRIVESFELLNH